LSAGRAPAGERFHSVLNVERRMLNVPIMNRRQFIRLSTLACACCAVPAHAETDRATTDAPRGVALRQDLIPDGKFGRQIHERLRVRYITVHSTESPGGTAATHARLLRQGEIRAKTQWNKRGYNFWHFTVDDVETVQHLPLDEIGQHADHEGPGNMTSIGIEICEFREAGRQKAAIARCASLVAWLRKKYRIPIDHVVPHYFWTMVHFNNWHKPCPRILLDNGKPGAKWAAFLKQVERA
jgi:N-acetylmuramoyl-L-alanine amidase